ncbi:hypothetical protein CEJ46_09280 [Vibrio anguillarum]|nr:hypothetical protein CEJ46_09280 [Vibrio anguillarum]
MVALSCFYLVFVSIVIVYLSKLFKGDGVHMSIQELIEAAKATPVTSAQIDNLRVRLKQDGNEQSTKSSSASKEFLSRTYSL